MHAHVVIGSIGNDDSHTEADVRFEVYQCRPTEGGIIPLTWISNISHTRSKGSFLLQELRCFNATHMMRTDVAMSEAV